MKFVFMLFWMCWRWVLFKRHECHFGWTWYEEWHDKDRRIDLDKMFQIILLHVDDEDCRWNFISSIGEIVWNFSDTSIILKAFHMINESFIYTIIFSWNGKKSIFDFITKFMSFLIVFLWNISEKKMIDNNNNSQKNYFFFFIHISVLIHLYL